MERWEQVETETVGNILREEDVSWERRKSFRRTTNESLHKGSSKRDAREQGGGKKRKKLKYDIVEDDWGARKTILEEHVTEENKEELLAEQELPTIREGAGSSVGGEDGRKMTIPKEGYGTATSPRVTTLPKKTSRTLNGWITRVGRSSNSPMVEEHRLGSPCREDIENHPPSKDMIFGDYNEPTGDTNIGEGIFNGNIVDNRGDNFDMIISPTVTDSVIDEMIPTPSVSRMAAPELCEDDIQVKNTIDNEKLECIINKKLKRCMRHDCEVKAYEVTQVKWQWIKSKQKYGNVHSKVKKYRCMRSSVRAQVPVSKNLELRKPAVTEVETEFSKTTIGTTTAGNNGGGSGLFESESSE